MSKQKQMYEYSSNNSGGGWWLSDEQWKALEDAGWEVAWGGIYFCRQENFSWNARPVGALECSDNQCHGHRRYRSYAEAVAAGDAGRWLGALATYAQKEFYSEGEAIAEFERVAEQNYSDEGCECCGEPHYISETKRESYDVSAGQAVIGG